MAVLCGGSAEALKGELTYLPRTRPYREKLEKARASIPETKIYPTECKRFIQKNSERRPGGLSGWLKRLGLGGKSKVTRKSSGKEGKGEVSFLMLIEHPELKNRNDGVDKILADVEVGSIKAVTVDLLEKSKHSPLLRSVVPQTLRRSFPGMAEKMQMVFLAPTFVPTFAMHIPILRKALGKRFGTFKFIAFSGSVSADQWEDHQERMVDFVHEMRAIHAKQLGDQGITDKFIADAGKAKGVVQRGAAAKIETTFCVGVGADDDGGSGASLLDQAFSNARQARAHYTADGAVARGVTEREAGIVLPAQGRRARAKRVEQLEETRRELSALTLPEGVLVAVPGQDKVTLSQDTREVIRSAKPKTRKSDEQGGREDQILSLQAALQARFGPGISEPATQAILAHSGLSDELEAGVFKKTRVILRWDRAGDQVLDADHGAQGARNGVVHGAALAHAEQVDEGHKGEVALRRARRAEWAATASMDQANAHFTRSVREIELDMVLGRLRGTRGPSAEWMTKAAWFNPLWWAAHARTWGRLAQTGDDGLHAMRKAWSAERFERFLDKLAAYEHKDSSDFPELAGLAHFAPRMWRMVLTGTHFTETGKRVAVEDGSLQHISSEGQDFHKAIFKRLEARAVAQGIDRREVDNIVLGIRLEPIVDGRVAFELHPRQKDGKALSTSLKDLLEEVVKEEVKQRASEVAEETADSSASDSRSSWTSQLGTVALDRAA